MLALYPTHDQSIDACIIIIIMYWSYFSLISTLIYNDCYKFIEIIQDLESRSIL